MNSRPRPVGADRPEAEVEGQSYHPASPNDADQLEPWVRVESLKLPMSDEAIARATVHTLTLTP